MKEIDFLPDWYKSGRRQRISYRTQYVVLAGIFVVMLVWNFVVGQSVSKATAELTDSALNRAQGQNTPQEFSNVHSELIELSKRARSMDAIDCKIDVASVVGELSFLITEKVVVSKIVFSAEKLENEKPAASKAESAVRTTGRKQPIPLGSVRFRLLISGVASQAGDVAALICSLEESPYFCRVTPSFSRNKKITPPASPGGKEIQVSEFEIVCYLANYREFVPHNIARGPV
ncbi:MAG TPA: hypothetical protein VMX13_09255 [Sedimentisphaerales bacterium]|nr:hypothetical protein [Sedimentisphaerales bacterium]